MNTKKWDALWVNALLTTLEEGYGLIKDGAIACDQGKIVWLGPRAELPGHPEQLAATVHDVAGACITPGLIDCHTHLVYAGNRYHEFELRLHGASYESIARAGGGIQSTVAATRLASEEDLLQQSLRRARALLKEGVTTIEIKSGYGLDVATELKILRVAKEIEKTLSMTVSLTFMGAHAIPVEYKNQPEKYVDLVCDEMLPAIAEMKLAHQVDVFCERIAFSLAQTERVFQKARALGLGIKCHAGQLSDLGAVQLAAKYQALSVEHLEFVSEEDVIAMAKANTVAVLLPGAFYFLRETQLPPIELFRKHRVPIAIATDCNPGSSPTTSLLLMLNMGCTLFRLTPEEVWMGVTKQAAKALNLESTHGSLRVGKVADLVVWDIEHPSELAYWIGMNPLKMLVKNGEII